MSDGEVKGKAEALIQLMKNLKLTFEQALTALSVPEIEWDGYRKLVEQIQTQATKEAMA